MQQQLQTMQQLQMQQQQQMLMQSQMIMQRPMMQQPQMIMQQPQPNMALAPSASEAVAVGKTPSLLESNANTSEVHEVHNTEGDAVAEGTAEADPVTTLSTTPSGTPPHVS